jgi:LCP family protein required for cell wall assembly
VLVVFAAGVLGYAEYQWRKVDRRSFEAGVLRDSEALASGEPFNVLLVGSDSRARDTEGNFGGQAEVGGQRSDSQMILRIDPAGRQAAIMSIPRDLYVTISCTGGKQRINTAFLDSPDCLVDTVSKTLGIPIDHYVQVDFQGFAGIVNALGGVSVNFDAPARDDVSGLMVENAGCQSLNGEMALAFVRSRHFEYKDGNKWKSDPTGDFGRIARQQDFVRRVAQEAIRKGARNPVTANSLVSSVVDELTIDDGLSRSDILGLARSLGSMDPEQIKMYTVPNTIGRAELGGSSASVLFLDTDKIDEVVGEFLAVGETDTADAANAIAGDPKSISVRALNGAGIGGLGARAGLLLQYGEFNVLGVGDADRPTYSQSVIRYAPGQENAAQYLASQLVETPVLEADPALVDSNLVLIASSGFRGLVAYPVNASGGVVTTLPPGAEDIVEPLGINIAAC